MRTFLNPKWVTGVTPPPLPPVTVTHPPVSFQADGNIVRKRLKTNVLIEFACCVFALND